MKKIFFMFIVFTVLSGFLPGIVWACDSCGCMLSQCADHTQQRDQNVFFNFTFEQQQWDVKDAREAHNLHHAGREFHDKTHEEFYHFTFGVNPTDKITLLSDIPYVVRGSLDIEHHATIGRKQSSEGLGDMNLIGIYKILVKNDDFLGISGGVKFPTGDTGELDPYGALFEPELQPGSGSWDYPVGIVYRYMAGPVSLSGNVSYVIKSQGAQEFRHGNLLFASLNADYILNPRSENFQTRVGWDTTFHNAQKDRLNGVEDDDSGETSVFMGPSIEIGASKNVSLFGNILLPVYQNTGGVHQKLSYLWTAGAKVNW